MTKSNLSLFLSLFSGSSPTHHLVNKAGLKNTNIIQRHQLKTILKLLRQRRANTEINKSLFTTEKLQLMTEVD